MRLFLLTSFTMIAFASNSILTRMAIEPGFIDPISFALIRVLAGAAFLCGMVLLKGGNLPWTGRARLLGASCLAVYMVGFSLAYVTLDAPRAASQSERYRKTSKSEPPRRGSARPDPRPGSRTPEKIQPYKRQDRTPPIAARDLSMEDCHL